MLRNWVVGRYIGVRMEKENVFFRWGGYAFWIDFFKTFSF